jgi:protocatechuate 3,4-dioxygenase beta subunit
MERSTVTSRRGAPLSILAAACVVATWTLAAQVAQTPQTVQRPGEPTRRPSMPGSDADAKTAVIRGRVVDVDGRPLRQAQIQLTGTRTREPRNESSDVDGRYEAGQLPADIYTVIASKPGYVTVEHGQRGASYPGTRIRIAEGEVVERIDFTLPRAAAIAGRVSDENGDPAQGATVALLQLQFVNGRRALARIGRGRRTNDLGRFRLYGVQPGQYVLVASAATDGPYRMPGYAPTYYPGSASAGDAQFIAVGAGDDQTALELRLMPGRAARVSGIALDPAGQPYHGGLLLAGSERAGVLAAEAVRASTQSDGSFEFINVAPGDYVAKTVTIGAFASRPVSVSEADVAGLTLRASPGSTVRGHITLEGARSRVTPQAIRLNFVLTDPDLGPPPGFYRAKINDDWTFEYVGLFGPQLIRPVAGPEWLVKSIRASGADITDTPMPFGTRDQSLSDVEIVLTNRGAAATGTVKDARDQPVRTCTVIVFAADRDRWNPYSRFVKAARCEPDGTFSIRGLPAAEYFAAAVDRIQESEGSGEWQDPAVLEALTSRASRVTLTDGQSASAALRLVVR